jgi:hypothetical protein
MVALTAKAMAKSRKKALKQSKPKQARPQQVQKVSPQKQDLDQM